MSTWPGVIHHYRSLIELPQAAPAIPLLEGNTPLVPLPVLAGELGAKSVHAKFEGLNPTGSFKDLGEIDFRGQSIVCVCTEHGLKDPDIITKHYHELVQIPAEVAALEELIVSP